jgi:hypothetical protein
MFHHRISAHLTGLISILVSTLMLSQVDQRPQVYVSLVLGTVPRSSTPSVTSLATQSLLFRSSAWFPARPLICNLLGARISLLKTILMGGHP